MGLNIKNTRCALGLFFLYQGKNIAKIQHVMLIHLRSAEADNPTEQSPGLLTSINQMHLKESKTLNFSDAVFILFIPLSIEKASATLLMLS